MNFRAKTASVLGATAVATASLVALPGTAHAAYPKCNSAKTVNTSHGNVRQPYFTGTGSRNCVMGVGARSTAVTRLQLVLVNCYNRNLTVDGRYGSSTSSAVKYVQQYEGLSSRDTDGVYGPLTRKAMKWHTSNGLCVRLGI